jgi:hypothetical protein
VTDAALLAIAGHLTKITCDLNQRFSDLKETDFPCFITQPVLIDLTVVVMQYRKELSEM